MHYDPIKKSLGKFFNLSPSLRVLFYKLLDLLLLRAWHVKRELDKWQKTAPQNAKILDGGAGFGQYTHHMSGFSCDPDILAVDVKQEQVDDCNDFFKKIGKDKVHFVKDNLVTFKKDNEFDLVICIDVIEHIEEDVQVMKNYYDSLKPGGMLLISTPSDQGGSDTHHHHDHDHDHEDGEMHGFIDEHVRDGYSLEDINTKLAKAGFSKSEARFQYGPPGKISWKISMKWPMLMLNASKIFFIILPFYYLLFFPIAFVLNMMDVRKEHKTGTGVIAVAWK